MEFIKNFVALLVSTATWFAGLSGCLGLIVSVFTFDVFVLIASAGALCVMGLGLLLGRYNKRIKVALEFPFGFSVG